MNVKAFCDHQPLTNRLTEVKCEFMAILYEFPLILYRLGKLR